MRYQNSSAISYFFRNFGKYFYLVLPIAVFMAIFANFNSETVFLQNWSNDLLKDESYVGDMMRAFLLIFQPNDWWHGIVTFLLLSVTFSLLIVKVSRHMRVGSFTMFPLKSALKVMPSMMLFCACFLLFAQILEFVSFGILYLLQGFFTMDAVIILGLVFLYLSKVVTVYVLMLLLCSFPLSYDENYPFNVAMSYSVREMSKRTGACILNAVIYATMHVVLVVVDYFILIPVLSNALYGLFFFFTISYVTCLAFTIHHQNLGSERKDISRVIIG